MVEAFAAVAGPVDGIRLDGRRLFGGRDMAKIES